MCKVNKNTCVHESVFLLIPFPSPAHKILPAPNQYDYKSVLNSICLFSEPGRLVPSDKCIFSGMFLVTYSLFYPAFGAGGGGVLAGQVGPYIESGATTLSQFVPKERKWSVVSIRFAANSSS